MRMLFWKIVSIVAMAASANESLFVRDSAELRDLVFSTDDKSTKVTIQLNSPISELPKIESHGTFLQLSFPKLMVPRSGEFKDINSPYISKIVAFQHSDYRATVRIIVPQDAQMIASGLNVQSQGSVITLDFDHEKIKSALRSDPKITAVPPKAATAEDVIKKTQISTTQEPPSVLVKQSTAKKQPMFSALRMNDKLGIAAAFCAVLFALMILVGFFKSKRFKTGDPTGVGMEMRSLSTKYVNPKHRIELFEIAGQKILLSIGQDQVSYLTTLQQMAPQPHPPMKVSPVPSEAPKRMAQVTKAVAKQNVQATRIQPIDERPIRVAINDEIKLDYSRDRLKKPDEAISDVTKMIREKLRNLPSVS